MSKTPSTWRRHARAVIGRVLAGLPAGATDTERRKAVQAAYPFGERQNHPYRCWLAEVKLALDGRSADRDTSIRFVASPQLWLDVQCGWCRYHPQLTKCVMCARHHDEIAAVVGAPQFRVFREAIRAEPGEPLHRLALADWLEENGHDALAVAVRPREQARVTQ